MDAAAFVSMLKEKWYPPPDCTESFHGKTVLVTGSNTGLGFETAKKLAALDAEKLIITTRSESKGASTKEQITQWLNTSKPENKTTIIPLVLDMNTIDGVKAFIDSLNSTTKRLDSVILNAGINQPFCKLSPDGIEETLQVNTISTVYLAVLLLSLLTSTADTQNVQAHLTFISSRNALAPFAMPSSEITNSPTPIADLGQESHFPQHTMGGQVRYGQSKLLLEYASRHISQLPSIHSKQGTPKVIVNSVCPGVCSTDLGRNYHNIFLKILMHGLFMPLFAKTAAQGANAYLAALIAGEETKGQMWGVTHWIPEWDHIKTAEGKEFGDKVWREMQDIITTRSVEVKSVLGTA